MRGLPDADLKVKVMLPTSAFKLFNQEPQEKFGVSSPTVLEPGLACPRMQRSSVVRRGRQSAIRTGKRAHIHKELDRRKARV
jgi:hypothetical protein